MMLIGYMFNIKVQVLVSVIEIATSISDYINLHKYLCYACHLGSSRCKATPSPAGENLVPINFL